MYGKLKKDGSQRFMGKAVDSASLGRGQYGAVDVKGTLNLVESLRDTAVYNLKLLEGELDAIAANGGQGVGALLEHRGFAYAAAGQTSSAIEDLNALVSQKVFQTGRNLAKLGQLLVRRGGAGDYERAIKIARRVVGGEFGDASTLWVAHQTLAAAYIGLKRYAEAQAETKAALKLFDDPRTHALRVIAEAHGDVQSSAAQLQLSSLGMFPQDLGGASSRTRTDMAFREVVAAEPMQ